MTPKEKAFEMYEAILVNQQLHALKERIEKIAKDIRELKKEDE